MNTILFYPAIFHKPDSDEDFKGYWIEFPDIPEALTQGENMSEAYQMAVDCLGLSLTNRQANKQSFPSATSPDKIKLSPNSFLVLIKIDLTKYQRKIKSKSIKKTLTIPEWLNDEAMQEGINFSQVLQEALISKLQSL